MELLAKTGRTFLHNCLNTGYNNLLNQKANHLILVRKYAKRKGYRMEAKKKKVKQVIEKKSWVPHNLREGAAVESMAAKQCMEHRRLKAVDDVWISQVHAWRIYGLREAIEAHREMHHPTMCNVPDAQINLFMELDMSTARPTRFVDKWKKMAMLPHHFEQEGLQERSILVFCKTPEQKEDAQNAGANLVGGLEIIKDIEKGRIVLPDFRFVLAHPSILSDLIQIRGLLKKRFPSAVNGTLDPDLGTLVRQFKNGVEYACLRDEAVRSYGWIDTTFGRLNMDLDHLEKNFTELLKSIYDHRPKRPGPFVTRVVMTTPHTTEKFKIDFDPYVPAEEVVEDSSDDEAVPAKA